MAKKLRTPNEVWSEAWPFIFGAACGAIAGWSVVLVLAAVSAVLVGIALYAVQKGW